MCARNANSHNLSFLASVNTHSIPLETPKEMDYSSNDVNCVPMLAEYDSDGHQSCKVPLMIKSGKSAWREVATMARPTAMITTFMLRTRLGGQRDR